MTFINRYLLIGFLGLTAAYGQGNSPGAHVPGQLVVQASAMAKPDSISKLFKSHGASVKRSIPTLNTYVLQVQDQTADAIMQSLARSGQFTFVERDGNAHSAAIPNDTSFASQWHLTKMNAPAAWDISTGSTGVTVAMVDSGVDPTHPDLASRLVAGWSFLTGTTDTRDVQGHGTATAGTLGAVANNAEGVAGITWKNPIMPLVVLNASDSASYSDIASAITYAADMHVRIINVSIGGNTPSSTLQSAVTYAWNKGSMVFAAAMNAGGSTPYYPAACDNAIAVSATDTGDGWAGFSNYGSWIDFAAPGVSILTTNNYGGYGYWQGTSFSSPLAAGVAALVLSINPSLSNTAVINILKQSSVDLGIAGFDTNYGWGRVDAYAAAVAARNTLATDAIPPIVLLNNPAAGAVLSGSVQIAGTATDNLGVARIELSIDGQLITSASGSPFSFPWNTATSANGAHTLTVRAYDAAGNTSAASATVTVNNQAVTDFVPPTVSITSPSAGSSVGGSKPASIKVAASDNVAVSQVCIYVDGVQVYSGTASPFTYAWNTKKLSAGTHVITATAWDKAGNSASAVPVAVVR